MHAQIKYLSAPVLRRRPGFHRGDALAIDDDGVVSEHLAGKYIGNRARSDRPDGGRSGVHSEIISFGCAARTARVNRIATLLVYDRCGNRHTRLRRVSEVSPHATDDDSPMDNDSAFPALPLDVLEIS